MSKSETSICKCGATIEADHQYVRHEDYAAAIAHNEYLLARLKKSDAQLAAIEADRQRRGHPSHTHCDNCGCTWLDDGLNPVGCPYCQRRGEPVKCSDPDMGDHACSDPSQCWEPCGDLGKSAEHAKVAEPVKVLSDLPHALWDLVAIWRKQQGEYPAEGKQAAAAVRLCANELELLLTRYGQSDPKFGGGNDGSF